MKRLKSPQFILVVIFCAMLSVSSWAKDKVQRTVTPNIKQIAVFRPDMEKKETTVTRIIDCEAGVICYGFNSHTYGYAVGGACVPIKDTLLLIREECDGTDKAE